VNLISSREGRVGAFRAPETRSLGTGPLGGWSA
jgi:hypothetical protein